MDFDFTKMATKTWISDNRKKQITEDVFKEIYDIFKIEMKLEDGKIPDDITHPCNIDADTPPTVIWKGVGNLHGVNKLKSGLS